LINEKKSI